MYTSASIGATNGAFGYTSPTKTRRGCLYTEKQPRKQIKEISQIKKFVKYLGIEESLLVDIKKSKVTESNLDEFGRYDALKKSIANEPATEYYTKLEGKKLPPFVVRNNAEKLLRDYILYDIDIKDPDGED